MITLARQSLKMLLSVPGSTRVRGEEQLARPVVAWVAEMGSAGGGKSDPVCNVGGA